MIVVSPSGVAKWLHAGLATLSAMRRLLAGLAAAVCLLPLGLAVPRRASDAQEARPADEPSPLERRARQFAAAISADPKWPEDLFDEAYRRNVPAASLRKLLADTFASEGAVTSVLAVRNDSAVAGRFELAFEKGGILQCDVRLADEPARPIHFLWMYRSLPGFTDLPAVAKALCELHGNVSFAVARLDGDRPETLASANPDAVLDIASGFKLYVLGALVDDIRAGRRRWTDTVDLDARLRSIPTGLLQRWPDGSPVTLHTLASLMIEQSDNTAADHLLALLGREKVESMLAKMGNAHAERNLPLLATGEMFRLKYADGGVHAAAFLSRPLAERRAYLAGVIAPIPIARIDTPSEREPRLVGTVGWFASASDLVAAMDWLRRATESGPAAAARAILAIEPGTSEPRDVFAYQGFKGGRLPGVASRTYLVRSASGASWAVSVVWNDEKHDVDEVRLKALLTRALQLLTRRP